jgi:hypothetical protein
MQVDVKVDFEEHSIEAIGDPHFVLVAIERIDILDSERSMATFDRTMERKFSKLEWRKEWMAGERRGLLAPEDNIKNFSRHVRDVRQDRIPVRLVKATDR